jgi:hypothetical protein
VVRDRPRAQLRYLEHTLLYPSKEGSPLRRFIPGIALLCVPVFAAVALAYPPASITNVTQDSVTLDELDCGTQYRIQIEARNSDNTGWETPTTQTATTLACAADAPAANFTVSPNPAVRNQATTFTSTGTCDATPCTYRWFHGDETGTEQIGTFPTAFFT